jgi:TonB family protein
MAEASSTNDLVRRRGPRYELAVPIDVIALRSGVPASIPGRTVNVSQRGVATVLAGELSPGERVGIEFHLPRIPEPIQAKAVVRHYSLMNCGFEFLAMPMEQENALRTWTQMADQSRAMATVGAVSQTAKEEPAALSGETTERTKPSQGLRWAFLSAILVVVVLLLVGWWSWNTGWHELEGDADARNHRPVAADVPSSVMGQRIVHRVDPIYPSEALKAKVQGEVTLEVMIGEDGSVDDVYAVNGPELLRPAAVDAVRWWRFEPYRVNGRATEVHTLMEVDFRLDR